MKGVRVLLDLLFISLALVLMIRILNEAPRSKLQGIQAKANKLVRSL